MSILRDVYLTPSCLPTLERITHGFTSYLSIILTCEEIIVIL